MASGGRCSELQALVFDPQYIQFKPKGAGVTLYFTPEFMRKNQWPKQVSYPWYIPAVPKRKGVVLKDPSRLQAGEVFSLSVGNRIMVPPEPVLADALPCLSNSSIIRNVI